MSGIHHRMEKVDADKIEDLVGTHRRGTLHVAAFRTRQPVGFFILHPHNCRDEYADLRECPYSVEYAEAGVLNTSLPPDRACALLLDDSIGRLFVSHDERLLAACP